MKTIYYLFLFTFLHFSFFAQDLNIERIWRNFEFSAKGSGAYQMMNDGLHFVQMNENGDIVRGLIADDQLEKTKLLVPKSSLVYNDQPIAVAGYEFNANEQKVLLWTAPKAIYRRSFEAFYFLYDLNTQKLEALDADHAPQTLAEYSSDGKKVSFIHGNDLFIKDLATGKVRKVTEDGKRNKIINGNHRLGLRRRICHYQSLWLVTG
jgi:dipeptidyl-peptidase 4